MIRQIPRDAGDDRVRVKDDFKLLAQCDCESISHLLTEDASTLDKYLDRARTNGVFPTQTVGSGKLNYDLGWVVVH